MKKKFLSLMMAAAVVATTSVSAFAAENNNVHVTMPESPNVTDSDSNSPTHDVHITGHVQNNKGEMPATSFKVTVPTAANFTVTKDGVVVGPELEVKNEGSQEIEVYATDFSKETNGKLKVVGTGELASEPRSTVSLKLTVDGVEKVYLAAGGQKNGVFTNGELDTPATDDAAKLLNVQAGANGAKTRKIKLVGSAGTNQEAINDAVSDTFKLVLKIKKAQVSS